MKRICLAIGSFALVALLGVTMAGRLGVDAQDTTTPNTSGTPIAGSASDAAGESAKDVYLATLAEKLGVTTEELQTAIDETNSELGTKNGHGGMGDWHGSQSGGSPNMPRKSGGMMRGVDLADAASFLGITEDQLRTELVAGSFLDIAEDHGKTTDEVRAFLIQQATAAIDERLQEAEIAPASDSATEVPATSPAMTPSATT